jgi:hypothetical protein
MAAKKTQKTWRGLRPQPNGNVAWLTGAARFVKVSFTKNRFNERATPCASFYFKMRHLSSG